MPSGLCSLGPAMAGSRLPAHSRRTLLHAAVCMPFGIFLINFVIIATFSFPKFSPSCAPQILLASSHSLPYDDLPYEILPYEVLTCDGTQGTLISGEANSSVSKREKTIIDRTIACYG